MNNRKHVRTASAVGGGAAVMMMVGFFTALIHLAGLAGDRYRSRQATQEK